jgi:hypothetical protein
MSRNHAEDQIQASIVDHIRTVLPGAIVLHIHNNPRSQIDGARLKKLGLVKGAPDLLVCLPRGKGLFIEVKSPKGRVRPEQHSFSFSCQPLQWPWFVARSIDDVRLAFKALGIATREADQWTSATSQTPTSSEAAQ